MRRIFTHLNSRWQTTPFHPWRKAIFLEDPDCPTLVDGNKQVRVEYSAGLLSLPGLLEVAIFGGRYLGSHDRSAPKMGGIVASA